MRIVLVRHAEAAPAGDGIDDAARPLTDAGRQTAARVAGALRAQGIEASRVLTSPRARAVATAEIFAPILGFAGSIERAGWLCYARPASEAARELTALMADGCCILAFGHMPTLPEIGKQLSRGRGPATLAPSEVLLIENGRARWSVDPESLRLTRH